MFQKGGTAHGVSRIDISHEYQYARTTYGLGYTGLKDLARASLEHAFLDGHSLWASGSARTGYRPVRACAGSRPGVVPLAPACARHRPGLRPPPGGQPQGGHRVAPGSRVRRIRTPPGRSALTPRHR
ncbi:hypothetical protein [Streptomyces rubiginosohelvolus]|uniref:hypothetical protein n=1 Tax=Streptomyces rubiginosohelvolus TaxID=67362 RepID=UPI0035DB8ACF